MLLWLPAGWGHRSSTEPAVLEVKTERNPVLLFHVKVEVLWGSVIAVFPRIIHQSIISQRHVISQSCSVHAMSDEVEILVFCHLLL